MFREKGPDFKENILFNLKSERSTLQRVFTIIPSSWYCLSLKIAATVLTFSFCSFGFLPADSSDRGCRASGFWRVFDHTSSAYRVRTSERSDRVSSRWYWSALHAKESAELLARLCLRRGECVQGGLFWRTEVYISLSLQTSVHKMKSDCQCEQF